MVPKFYFAKADYSLKMYRWMTTDAKGYRLHQTELEESTMRQALENTVEELQFEELTTMYQAN